MPRNPTPWTLWCLLLVRLTVAQAPDYYDRLHSKGALEFSSDPLSESHVGRVTFNSSTYRLAHLATFLPLSNKGVVRAGSMDQALGVLLAVHHFNNKHESPIFRNDDSLIASDCNVRLTVEIIDSQFDPIVSTDTALKKVAASYGGGVEPIPPAGIIGAYRSAVTSPVTLVAGAYKVPQISAMSTSADFLNQEQYPFFGRTCPSSEGEGRVAVEYIHFLGRRFRKPMQYVGILFVTDAYGVALQRAFADSATSLGITTLAYAFGYNPTEEDLKKVILSLKATQFHYFYVICFESHVAAIMNAAAGVGIAGNDYFWLFHGPDMGALATRYPKGRFHCSVWTW